MIVTEKQKEQIELIIEFHGILSQKLKSLEEMNELQTAIFNDVNKGFNCRNDIIEEIADVLIMIEQLSMIYEIPKEIISFAIDTKIDREINRIKERLNIQDENGDS